MKPTIALLCGAVLIAGCATKRYPMATQLSPVQAAEMTCRELALELSEVEQTQEQIANTSEIDWRSGAAFLMDLGIGNAMAKNEAESALAERRRSIRQAQADKSCTA
tara:strand:- start:3159 stop:3479 length:321 start_codon:yes stop_codon:yes gene_type:complete